MPGGARTCPVAGSSISGWTASLSGPGSRAIPSASWWSSGPTRTVARRSWVAVLTRAVPIRGMGHLSHSGGLAPDTVTDPPIQPICDIPSCHRRLSPEGILICDGTEPGFQRPPVSPPHRPGDVFHVHNRSCPLQQIDVISDRNGNTLN